MNFMTMYTRVLTELHMSHYPRTADEARVHLQDVLCALRNLAANERDDPTGQATQDEAETLAYHETRKRK